ncbi:MAG TPA: helix-turn-helix domain-containing protein, partial [Candidatus Aminicenantes bacterium]|nr:helix-turn-helix domain-containing protein [Candidatus Aminicenantes bacterium]
MLVNAYLLSPRQREIAEAALSILSNTGVQSLTMKMIAARLQITDAALYRHFQNKEELLEGIALLFEESSRKTLERIAAENLAPLERVKTFFLDRCR